MGNDNVKDYPPYLDYPKPRQPQAKVTEELDGWWEAFKALADMVKSDSVKDLAVKTNADRIRHMTDEELAEFIQGQIIDRNIGIPSETWLDWLKEEAKE